MLFHLSGLTRSFPGGKNIPLLNWSLDSRGIVALSLSQFSVCVPPHAIWLENWASLLCLSRSLAKSMPCLPYRQNLLSPTLAWSLRSKMYPPSLLYKSQSCGLPSGLISALPTWLMILWPWKWGVDGHIWATNLACPKPHPEWTTPSSLNLGQHLWEGYGSTRGSSSWQYTGLWMNWPFVLCTWQQVLEGIHSMLNICVVD